MFRRDTHLSCVAILSIFAISFVIIAARIVHQNDEVLFKVASRSLSLPVTYNKNAHKCVKEVPTILTVESNKPIIGNGTNSHWTKLEVCCEGYKRYEYNWNICVPDCGRKCQNGVCVAPGHCRCFPRYVRNDDGECVTTCPLGCLNGKCSFDGRCTCNTGYRIDSSGTFCRPYCREGCNRLHQNCTYPDQCDCSKGYTVDESMRNCIPYCKEGCGDHGQCIEPDKCECQTTPNAKYDLKNGVCQPKCRFKCDNGLCVNKDRCQCFHGYRYDDHLTSCIPTCTRCRNGVCVEPEVCKCFHGYTRINGECEPQCPQGCVGGECKEPNYCRCPYGRVDRLGHCRSPDENDVQLS